MKARNRGSGSPRAIARPEGRASFDALRLLAMTIPPIATAVE
jgi:hypothetical protein